MTTVGNYLVLLPQQTDALYVYPLSALQEQTLPRAKTVSLPNVRSFRPSCGWEAITAVSRGDNTYTLYLSFEDVPENKSFFYEANIVLSEEDDSDGFVSEVLELTEYGELDGDGNSSYEALAWLPARETVAAGLLVIPEKTPARLQPYVLHGPGVPATKVDHSGSLDRYRLTDVVRASDDPFSLIGTSFCWVSPDETMWDKADQHCFAPGDERHSRLQLLHLSLRTVRNRYVMNVDPIMSLDVDTPSMTKTPAQYNAEGIAWTPQGFVLVNDNSPGGAVTALRIIPLEEVVINP
jgi:hypothetical protein